MLERSDNSNSAQGKQQDGAEHLSIPGGFAQFVSQKIDAYKSRGELLSDLKQLAEIDGYDTEIQNEKEDGCIQRLLRHQYNLLPVDMRYRFELESRKKQCSSKQQRLATNSEEGVTFGQIGVREMEKSATKSSLSEITFATEHDHRLMLARVTLLDHSCPICAFSCPDADHAERTFPAFTISHLLAHPHAKLYACHCCLKAFVDVKSLDAHHCEEFTNWKIVEGHWSRYDMEAARVYICCGDCGDSFYCNPRQLYSFNEFASNHLPTRLVTVVVYFADGKINENRDIFIKFTPSFARELFIDCSKCGIETFKSTREAESHFSDTVKHPETVRKKCKECKAEFSNASSFNKHVLKCYKICDENFLNSILLADWLSNIASLFNNESRQIGINGSLAIGGVTIPENKPSHSKYAGPSDSLPIERVRAKNKRAREREQLSSASRSLTSIKEISEEESPNGVWVKSEQQKAFIRRTIYKTDAARSIDLHLHGFKPREIADGKNINKVSVKKVSIYNSSIKNHLAQYQETMFLKKESKNNQLSSDANIFEKVYLCLECYQFLLGERIFLDHMKTCQPGADPYDPMKAFPIRTRGLPYSNRPQYYCHECAFYGCSLLSLRAHLVTKHQIPTHSLIQTDKPEVKLSVGEQFDEEIGLVNGLLPRRSYQRNVDSKNATMASHDESVVLSDSDGANNEKTDHDDLIIQNLPILQVEQPTVKSIAVNVNIERRAARRTIEMGKSQEQRKQIDQGELVCKQNEERRTGKEKDSEDEESLPKGREGELEKAKQPERQRSSLIETEETQEQAEPTDQEKLDDRENGESLPRENENEERLRKEQGAVKTKQQQQQAPRILFKKTTPQKVIQEVGNQRVVINMNESSRARPRSPELPSQLPHQFCPSPFLLPDSPTSQNSLKTIRLVYHQIRSDVAEAPLENKNFDHPYAKNGASNEHERESEVVLSKKQTEPPTNLEPQEGPQSERIEMTTSHPLNPPVLTPAAVPQPPSGGPSLERSPINTTPLPLLSCSNKPNLSTISTGVKHGPGRPTVCRRRAPSAISDELFENPTPSIICFNGPITTPDEFGSQLAAPIREEAPQSVSNVQSCVTDDGEDEILVVQAAQPKKPTPEKNVQVVQQGDDDCMIEEIVALSSAQLSMETRGGREKKQKCPKCSQKFLTAKRLNEHLLQGHKIDGGGSTTVEREYGLPLIEDRAFYICVMCSSAYDDPGLFRKHMTLTHSNCPPIVCPLCSFAAFNSKTSEGHWKFHQQQRVSRGIPCICLEHNLPFATEMELMLHAHHSHGTNLLFFCKKCFYATFSGGRIIGHVRSCREKVATNRIYPSTTILQDETAIGVVSANAIHYQPQNEPQWQEIITSPNPPKTVVPSICSHRTLLAQNFPLVLCNERTCSTWYIEPTYIGTFEHDQQRVEALTNRAKSIPRQSSPITKILERYRLT